MRLSKLQTSDPYISHTDPQSSWSRNKKHINIRRRDFDTCYSDAAFIGLAAASLAINAAASKTPTYILKYLNRYIDVLRLSIKLPQPSESLGTNLPIQTRLLLHMILELRAIRLMIL